MEKMASEKQIAFAKALWVERGCDAGLDFGSGSDLTMARASELIAHLLTLPKVANKPARPQLEEGIYFKAGVVYKVQLSGAGRFYAKVLQANGFVFDPTAIKNLSIEDKITLEQAKAYGIQYGVCCVCGRTLTDSVSVAEGIGPVCGKRI